MAKITFAVETVATGPLSLSYMLTEDQIQAVFAGMVGRAAKITVDGVERPRTLGECLKDEVSILMARLIKQAQDYAPEAAAEAARKAVAPVDITPIEVAA